MENANINHFPEHVLLRIFSLIEPTRARNAASLVSRRWYGLERLTRSSLSLHGNLITNPYPPHSFPRFPSVSSLDVSNLSPWGRVPSDTPFLVLPTLPHCFPAVTDLTLYSRDRTALISLTHHWPLLKRVKLIRWQNRPNGAHIGSDLNPLFDICQEIEEVDLNEFYCWTEDVVEAVRSHPLVARNLTGLDLMLTNSTYGFRASELVSIVEVCPSLRRLIAPCVFHTGGVDFVSDETLHILATNCPHLTTLHLLAANDLQVNHPLAITAAGLETVFSSLPLLTDFSLDLPHPILEAGRLIENLGQCRASLIQNLKLGNFEGVCKGMWLHLDGVAICGGLKSLCLKRCHDVSDASLAAIGRGCTGLAKFELIGCDLVTELGIQKLAKKFEKRLRETGRQTLKDLTVIYYSVHLFLPRHW
ncbi:F-box protein MAX2 [Rhynchospora pubera]|uniref:F-box protein MAX2 n=1 Tax=Rhynchospora pubera TaxID=906938 RepID=A0AAV8GZC6_9POAL|nr:F-box protein MAX2 [Rhynchospora pubera]